jgi:hypothetical protein
MNLGMKSVGIGQRRDALKPQLPYQSVLKGLVHALDPTFGLGAIRTDDVDVELGQRTAELSDATVGAVRTLAGDAKDAVLVAVERDGFPWRRRYERGGGKVGERRLGFDEPQLHQAPSRIVDVDEERAVGTALLKPMVLAAVDLDELAKALAAKPRHGCGLGMRWSLATQIPARIKTRRRVSLPILIPCSSRSFSRASVGPKSS